MQGSVKLYMKCQNGGSVDLYEVGGNAVTVHCIKNIFAHTLKEGNADQGNWLLE